MADRVLSPEEDRALSMRILAEIRTRSHDWPGRTMFLQVVPKPEWWDSFFACVWKIQQPDGCWIWTGPWDGCGYGMYSWGRVYLGGKRRSALRAHRFLLEQYLGKIPRKLVVLHSCDTPCCVNPQHLSIGTIQENVTDRDNKGRAATKLTIEEVCEIRAFKGSAVGHEVARAYGVSQSLISNIWNGNNWRRLL